MWSGAEVRLAQNVIGRLVVGGRDAVPDQNSMVLGVGHKKSSALNPDALRAAKGFVVGLSLGPTLFTAPGIQVIRPGTEQLLAMKLSAWRDDVDISDATRLMQDLAGEQEEVWTRVEPFLQPGTQLKAKFAFLDLWEKVHDRP